MFVNHFIWSFWPFFIACFVKTCAKFQTFNVTLKFVQVISTNYLYGLFFIFLDLATQCHIFLREFDPKYIACIQKSNEELVASFLISPICKYIGTINVWVAKYHIFTGLLKMYIISFSSNSVETNLVNNWLDIFLQFYSIILY